MKQFVIYLATHSASSFRNDYGYWQGKTYVVNGEVFPCCDDEITENTKRYTSKKRAENMAAKLEGKFGHVNELSVKEC